MLNFKFIRYSLWGLVYFTPLYLLWAFVNGSFNSVIWSEGGKSLLVLLWVCIMFGHIGIDLKWFKD